MRDVPRKVGLAAVALLALLAISIGAIYINGERRLRKRYEYPRASTLSIPGDSASIARGAHIVTAITACAECHGPDLGGKVYMDAGPLGVVAGPNLTRGRGGVGGQLTDGDWVRTLRYGVRPDGRSMIVMPSEVLTHLSDTDIGSVIAYVRQIPPVDREISPSRFGPVGMLMLGAGKLRILVAPKTPRLESRVDVQPGVSEAYGAYIADIAGCRGCHGLHLSGGVVAGPPGTPLTSNLTPTGLGAWTEADFFRALREGRRPDGTTIDRFMPWPYFAGMSDDELRALWLYLRSVPPMDFGNR